MEIGHTHTYEFSSILNIFLKMLINTNTATRLIFAVVCDVVGIRIPVRGKKWSNLINKLYDYSFVVLDSFAIQTEALQGEYAS
jgi:hypothetical protein